MSEQTYSAADLDRIFGPGAAEHAARLAADVANKNIPAALVDAVPAVEDLVNAGEIFYHLYVCPWIDCLKAANPVSGSWHQRGVHLAQSTPRTDVKCPGCGKPMVIGRDGELTSDANGNAVLHGDPIIQDAPGQPDQTDEIEAENKR